MAQIKVFEGGIAREAPGVTPFRAPDFGPGIAPGVEKLGQSVGESAQKVNEIEDLHARIEANKLSIAYNNLQQSIGLRVKSTLGDGAEAAADKGIEDLQSETEKLLSGTSARVRNMVAPQLSERTTNARGEWLTHGFEQKKQAFDTSSQAANDKDLEAAGHTDTDEAAKPFLDSIAERNHQRATFFGLGSDWETAQNLKAVSGFHRGRAESIGANSAYDAIQYAIHNRPNMSDDDFNAVLRSYREEALHERAISMYYGAPLGNEPTVTAAPPGTTDEPAPTKSADPSMVFNGLIVPNEGSKLVAHDSNGAPVKYGINQKDNPGVDVASLTQAGAEKIFIDKYWKPSGADKLAPALAVVHADTYYLNPSEATKILKESGGDVDKYMELRDGFLARLHASDPVRYPDYSGRNKRVADYAAAVGGNGQAFTFNGKVGPDTPMAPLISEVMARTDMPLALKTAIIDVAREDRNAQREDRAVTEDKARDTLISEATKLGDNFTSVKQLPADALSTAKPETVKTLVDWAKENHDRKTDLELRPLITEVQVTDPQKFMSKDFILELMKKGAPPALIGEVQQQQAEIAKKQMNQKPDVVSSGELWTIAKPAFEASGIDVEDRSLVKTAKGRQAAAKQKQDALTFLNGLATDFAYTHPGEKPTEQIMRQWIGAALLKTRSGTPLYEANDADVVNSLSDNVRNSIVRDLRRHGNTSSGAELNSDVASYYRKLRALYGTGPIRLSGSRGVLAEPLRGIATNPEAQ